MLSGIAGLPSMSDTPTTDTPVEDRLTAPEGGSDRLEPENERAGERLAASRTRIPRGRV